MMLVIFTATMNTITKDFSNVKNILKSLPWWGYLIILGIIVLAIYLPIHIKALKKRQFPAAHDPITKTNLPLTVIPGNAQHIGSRSEQQDSFAFTDIYDHSFINKYGVLAVLADGMGGLIGGKEASFLAVQTFVKHYQEFTCFDSIPDKLVSAIQEANQSVIAFAKQNGLDGGIGTTLIAAVVFKNQLYWLSVGDSRIYLYQNHTVKQLTTDHIYAKELEEKAASGHISWEEAESDPQRESLTSFLGLKEIKELDVTFDPIPLEKGDSIILCSDGLYGSVTNEEMMEACSSLLTQQAADRLIELALKQQKPHQDNATVAILRLG
ncbi:PP2C family protein-serine/threonine phosphatase [Bacillus sp. FJAT-29937]|uniref:PP2C family protein-serine/threonine phosphatase n=1 Tax=Bacillus sp. FJAT-29937 TaxID=1720553 RepID=UPI000835A780|nr:protein phosphatase 2C domain-containing protein [Bacillus sp. FJAT-29937]